MSCNPSFELKRQIEDYYTSGFDRQSKKLKKINNKKISSILEQVSLNSQKSCNINALKLEAKRLNPSQLPTSGYVVPSARNIIALAFALLGSSNKDQNGHERTIELCLTALSRVEFGKLLKILSQIDEYEIKHFFFKNIYNTRDLFQPLTFRSTQEILQFALSYCQKLALAPERCFENIPAFKLHSELERQLLLKKWEASLKARLDLSKEREIMLTRYFMNCVGQETKLTRRPQLCETGVAIGLSSVIELFQTKEEGETSNGITLPVDPNSLIPSLVSNVFFSSIVTKDYDSKLPEKIKCQVTNNREAYVFEETVMGLELDFLDAFISPLTPKHWPRVFLEPVLSVQFPILEELEACQTSTPKDEPEPILLPQKKLSDEDIFGDLEEIFDLGY